MKTDQNKQQRSFAQRPRRGRSLWNILRSLFGRRPIVDDVMPDDARDEQSEPPLSPLDRIREHLQRHGLGQQVRVRCEPAGGGFVLEDDEGFVHAKDYAAAVAVIEQMWLYQP